MLKRGRSQRLVLKASELGRRGLEAYRLLLRRYEPISTATTVPKLADTPATTYRVDLLDALTDFERRVTFWEHDAKEALIDLIKNWVAIRGVEKCGFRDYLLITLGHDRMDEICEQNQKR